MEPFDSGELKLDLHETGTVAPGANGVNHPSDGDRVAARRADIDAKQEQVARLLEAMGCEGALLLMPAHVGWFTAGMNVRGLIADSERPGVYTNGRQRWLLGSNADTQRLFDEELDRLGFQLKEWAWDGGRAELLQSVTAGKQVAADRPFPHTHPIAERLRPLVRVLSAAELEDYRALGARVAHAVEATARAVQRGMTEEDVAGHVGHRLLHRGVEPAAISVTADDRGAKYRRAGFTDAAARRTFTIQATGLRGGLYVTAGRTVGFGPVPAEFRKGYDRAALLAAVFRASSVVGGTMQAARESVPELLAGTTHEFDGRLSPPGFGTGRFPAEELRRAGHDEPFAAGQPLVWQPRIGPAAVVDTVVVAADGPECVTPPTDWPYKRITVAGLSYDIPDVLEREG
ncbi:M24 family metallopeptidase [Urbifossiella limnaea]|uniref:M24 family metallopeptidase n=1 Tax=Urbifossiella limnaea TaxID=2528023 RepID=A0A517XZG4_9BACT|nr:M24 family metallopeptidase [Urbifossiella limnaea]QDU22899.1 hypothetical protein ETAA1_48880 [Urbifossiella limnaea]